MEKDFGFKLIHLGINCENEERGRANAALLSTLFGFAERDAGVSNFVGEQFEVMYFMGRGHLGHFGMGTTDILGAKAWLESQGIEFADDSAVYVDGKLKLIYAKTEIAGFAFHLTQIA